ncbi:hypothetical protein SEA_ABBA_71 [Arthrobacter phage Abba]|uniref:Uncharacterized protein n=1 Tax=Arthrobacter phage Abba TaxID=2713256 RepID=A0A6G8R2H2_9CAUD|nr:hypothetical protein HYQ28_gp71 [Arthrobacter phage Abba]QIN94400.1 hypothetical protein SEA_ABBA_71 [Arthrobacter phage Abba]
MNTNRPAATEPVFVVTSSAPDEIELPAAIEAALVAIHADLLIHGLIAADPLSRDQAPKFRVHLRPEGEGIAAFWTDGKGHEWRVEFPDADRNVTELVAFEWQDLVDEYGRPIMAGEQKLGGRWHTASTMTRIARVAVERAGL